VRQPVPGPDAAFSEFLTQGVVNDLEMLARFPAPLFLRSYNVIDLVVLTTEHVLEKVEHAMFSAELFGLSGLVLAALVRPLRSGIAVLVVRYQDVVQCAAAPVGVSCARVDRDTFGQTSRPYGSLCVLGIAVCVHGIVFVVLHARHTIIVQQAVDLG
jgi:hypothetical protein